MKTNKQSAAYSEGQRAFKNSLDFLEDNPYNTKNMHNVLPKEYFEWSLGFDDAWMEHDTQKNSYS